MCVYIYIYIYTCICIYACVCIYIYIYIHIHTRISYLIFILKIPENSIESLDESSISRLSLEVLTTILGCFRSKSRPWNLRYEHPMYENGRRHFLFACDAFRRIAGSFRRVSLGPKGWWQQNLLYPGMRPAALWQVTYDRQRELARQDKVGDSISRGLQGTRCARVPLLANPRNTDPTFIGIFRAPLFRGPLNVSLYVLI